MRFRTMLSMLKESLAGVPEHRQGENTSYEITDAGLSSFGVFFMQSPSFLAHQRDMQRRKGENNASGLFGVKDIPSDGQIRNLLDPLDAGKWRRCSGGYMRNWLQEGIWTTIRVLRRHA